MDYKKKYLKYKKKYQDLKNNKIGVSNQKDDLFLSTHKLKTMKNKYNGGANLFSTYRSGQLWGVPDVIYVSHISPGLQTNNNDKAKRDFSTFFTQAWARGPEIQSIEIKESLTGLVLRGGGRRDIFAAFNNHQYDYHNRLTTHNIENNVTPFEDCIGILEEQMPNMLPEI